MSTLHKLITAALSLLLFTACLEMQTSIEMNANGSGTLTLEYRVLEELLNFAQYDGIPSQLSLPVNSEEFQRIDALNEGLRVLRYRSRTQDGTRIISARIQFDSPEALGAIFGSRYNFVGADIGDVGENSGAQPQILEIPLVEGLGDLSAEQRSALASAEGVDSVAFHFAFNFEAAPPRRSPSNTPDSEEAIGIAYSFTGSEPASLSEERSGGGLSLSFTYTLADLIDTEGFTSIEFRWNL